MSSPPQALATDRTATSISCDALVVAAFSSEDGPQVIGSEVTEALGSRLEDLAEAGFVGKLGEVIVIPTLGAIPAKAVALIGVGNKASVSHRAITSATATAAKRLSHVSEIVSVAHEALDDRFDGARASVEGFALGCYRFNAYKSDPRDTMIQRVTYPGADVAALELGTLTAEAAWLCRDLINEPASTLTPEMLARKAREVADVNGLSCTVFEEDELRDHGFGGLLATAQGADAPPRFIHLSYEPAEPTESIALVGKGVTFDSGGLSLKPAASMELMKTDMAGAAAVLAVMGTLKRLGVRAKVDAYLPTTENMTGGAAMRPGDVIRHVGGKTTEVINTDAEGRLILADALAWASKAKPDVMIDVATLTGSMTIALGKKASGLFSNDDELREELLTAAETAGERTWPFPLYEDYLSELDSDVADHKNSGIRWGGAIIAAMFLKQFVGPGIRWAHMDIAGTGRSERDYLEITRGGTGVPVRTLIEWLRTRPH